MNKLLRLLLAILLVTVLVLGIAACGEEDTPAADNTDQSTTDNTPAACTHTWVDATCTAPKTCSLCQATEGAALGHDMVTDAAVAATCTEDGLTEGSHCSRCDAATTAQTVVPALGHDMVTDAAVAPTCTETGLTEGSHCSRCDAATTAQTVVPALGHSTTAAEDRAATCTEKAYCSVCQSEYGEALGHSTGAEGDRPGDCETQAYCSRCQQYYGELGHSVGAEGDRAADCENKAYCHICQKEYGEALGHSTGAEDDRAADCTNKAYCSVCQKEYGEALGHDMVTDEAVDPTCTEDGLTEGSHCSRCDGATTAQTVVPALGHSTGAEGDRAADCTNKAYCSRCEKEYGNPLGHTLETVAGKAATCTEDGLTDGKACTVCGEVVIAQKPIPAGHKWGAWAIEKEPSETENGKRTRTCPVCSETETIEYALGVWEEYNLTVNTEGVKVLGERNATKASDAGILLDWAGSGLELNVHLDTYYTVRVFVSTTAAEGTCTFAVYVDGELFGDGYYTIACGMEGQYIDIVDAPMGDHVIRIVKVTDYTATSAKIDMIWMDGNFLATPADNDLYIEFVGDSITTGFEDVTKSYAWLVAESFNADYAITALNGYGLANGSAEVGTGSMAGYYDKINPLDDPLNVYRFSREADIVVVNLGAEDYYFDEVMNGEILSGAAFQKAYEALLAKIRYYNADAKILCVYGAANDGYAAEIEAAAAAAGGADEGIWTLKLDLSAEAVEGELVLPTADEQAAYAEAIAVKINEIKDIVLDEPVYGEGESQDWDNTGAFDGEWVTL